MTPAPTRPERAPRSDKQANRERLLAAAAHEVQARGYRVPMSDIADRAGVGIGTLYRHFPTRERLLGALTTRAFTIVLARAETIRATDRAGIDCVARYFAETIDGRADLILPLHGGPITLTSEDRTLQRQIRAVLDAILERGRADGTIRDDVTARDVVILAAHLAQPLAHIDDWDDVARRQARIYLAGLAPIGVTRAPGAGRAHPETST